MSIMSEQIALDIDREILGEIASGMAKKVAAYRKEMADKDIARKQKIALGEIMRKQELMRDRESYHKELIKTDTSLSEALDIIKESKKMKKTADMNRDHLDECACFGCDKPKCRERYIEDTWNPYTSHGLCRHCGTYPVDHAGYWSTEGVFAGGSCKAKHLILKKVISKTFKRYNHAFSSEYVFEK